MATEDQLRAKFEALRQRIEADGCEVVTRIHLAGDDPREGGYFVHDPSGRGIGMPRIVIYRPDHQDKPGPALAELVTLAHESGHFRSHQQGARSADYLAIIDLPRESWPDLAPAARALILDEEIRAWNLGTVELEAHGFTDWPACREAALAALGIYGQLLELPVEPGLLLVPPVPVDEGRQP